MIYLETTDKVLNALHKNDEYIKNEVYCDSILTNNKSNINYFDTEINGEICKFYIKKI